MRDVYTARRGFTLIEVTVALIVVLILAAVTVPTLISTIDQKKVADTRDQLVEVRNSVSNALVTGFYDRVGAYPGRLSELSQPISTTVANHPNSCGTAFTAAQVTNWNSFGPFNRIFIPTTGLPVPIGRIENVLVRNPTTATAGTLAFRILAATTSEATELDYMVDVSDGATAGTVRWVTPSATGGAGFADISYVMSVANKC